jgi:hypothetical protein
LRFLSVPRLRYLTLGAAAAVLAIHCSLEPIDYTGKTCPTGECGPGFSCIDGFCFADGTGPDGSVDAGQDGGPDAAVPDSGMDSGVMDAGFDAGMDDAGEDAGLDAGHDAGMDAGTDAGVDAGMDAGFDAGVDAGMDAGVDAGPTTTTVGVAGDSDDATWLGGGLDPPIAESLFESGSTFNEDEVGDDGDHARSAFRFALPVPKNATIVSAKITLVRSGGDATTTDTMLVQVYDTSHATAFNGTHMHTAQQHNDGGVLASFIGMWSCGTVGMTTTSPDLSALVQAIVNRADWASGDYIGFVVNPQTMGTDWATFIDSSSVPTSAAQLTVIWR